MKRRLWLPVGLEVVGIVVVGTGIGIELATHAEFGYMIISIGSALVAGGGIIWGKFVRAGRDDKT